MGRLLDHRAQHRCCIFPALLLPVLKLAADNRLFVAVPAGGEAGHGLRCVIGVPMLRPRPHCTPAACACAPPACPHLLPLTSSTAPSPPSLPASNPSPPLPPPFQALWAFCVYLEAVSVLPQLRMMQKAKVVERFTAHYVFALGLSRFMSCAHWLLQLLEGNKYLLQALGSGLWPVMVLLSEIVQTFILADFWWVVLRVCCAVFLVVV